MFFYPKIRLFYPKNHLFSLITWINHKKIYASRKHHKKNFQKGGRCKISTDLNVVFVQGISKPGKTRWEKLPWEKIVSWFKIILITNYKQLNCE